MDSELLHNGIKPYSIEEAENFKDRFGGIWSMKEMGVTPYPEDPKGLIELVLWSRFRKNYYHIKGKRKSEKLLFATHIMFEVPDNELPLMLDTEEPFNKLVEWRLKRL